MNRRRYLRRAALAAICGGRSAGAERRRPNVLLVLADQWRGQTMPRAGATALRAPHLEALAREGAWFRRAYTVNPGCSPARAVLITGRYPHACGVMADGIRLPPGQPSLAAEFERAGYATGYIGKWHLDGDSKPGFVPPGPRRHGFGYWAAFNRGHSYHDFTYFRDEPEPIRERGFEPNFQTDLAIEFIGKHRDSPFFLVFSWGPPHPPLTPPEEFGRLYRPAPPAVRQNVPREEAESVRKEYAGYYGLCSALDANLGRLLDALKAAGLRDDTIIVFTSDHGDMLGSHGLTGPHEPFEESLRVPLVMRYPHAINSGIVIEDALSSLNLAPTLLGLSGIRAPEEMQGLDVSARLKGEDGSWPVAVYTQGRLGTPQEWRAVVRGLQKAVVGRDMNITHLFNLREDPYELDNLINERTQQRSRDEMSAFVRHMMQQARDRILPSGLMLRE